MPHPPPSPPPSPANIWTFRLMSRNRAGFTLTSENLTHFPRNYVGAGMELNVWLKQLDVSFYRVQIKEPGARRLGCGAILPILSIRRPVIIASTEPINGISLGFIIMFRIHILTTISIMPPAAAESAFRTRRRLHLADYRAVSTNLECRRG